MPSIPASQSNRTSAVSYAVWLISQQPRLSQQSLLPSILGKYPELTLGEAESVASQAAGAMQAGAAFGLLPPQQQVSPSAVPVDSSLAGVYRTHAQVEIPLPGGEFTVRDSVVETGTPPTLDQILDQIAQWLRDLCLQQSPSVFRGAPCPSLEEIRYTIVSIVRGTGT